MEKKELIMNNKEEEEVTGKIVSGAENSSGKEANKEENKKKVVECLSMFFAGLILLIPHRIGMSCVNYVIKRYNLPISRAELLLYKFHNPIEVSLLIGTLLGNIIVWLCKGTKTIIIVFMFFLLSLMFFSSIYMFHIYIYGDDFGYSNLFYFSLILISLFDGFVSVFAFAINAKYASMFAAGIPVSGSLLSLSDNIYIIFSDSYHWNDFDYNVFLLQLLINIILILITLILWTCNAANCLENVQNNNQEDNNAANKSANSGEIYALFSNNTADWSPILMLAISFGTVYAFYPSIVPYQLIEYQYASVIELWILIISVISTLLIALLDLNEIGPGGVGENKNWAGRWWNLIWFCAIPYILCIQIFMSMLHYPDSTLSQFLNNPYCIGFISVLFNTLRETMQVCGFAGAGKQSTQANKHVNGAIAACNKLIALIVMMFCVFTGDGYLQHYRRCCRDNWPTTGFNKYQSFFYWLYYGFKGGSKSFLSTFTWNNRPQNISYEYDEGGCYDVFVLLLLLVAQLNPFIS